MGTRAISRVLVTLLLATALIGPAALAGAQAASVDAAWVAMNPAAEPSRRWEHGMAYDSESDRIILFGGISPDGPPRFADTWSYGLVSDAWIQLSPAVSPSPRAEVAMAYDSESDRIILFGGGPEGGHLSDETWAYDFNTDVWSNMNPAVRPSKRTVAAIAYDAESDRVIIFGGWTGTSTDNQTWAYDDNSNTWENLRPTVGPSARGTRMAYDAESDRIILFGGAPGFGRVINETWSYDYNRNTWTRMHPPTEPSPRGAVAIAYDAESDLVVIQGGQIVRSVPTNQTWGYDYNSDNWTFLNLPKTPPAQIDHDMVYDTHADRIVLLGDSQLGPGTWTFQYSVVAAAPGGEPLTLWLIAASVAVGALVAVLWIRRTRRRRDGS